MIGVVVFSFGLRRMSLEPNPCNIKLGDEVARITKEIGGKFCIVAQWEVARRLHELGIEPDEIMYPYVDGSYLDSRGVWSLADFEFRSKGITDVIVVAQPFLHLWAARKMVRDDGYEVIPIKIGKIGFDDERDSDGQLYNTQPWTTSRWALLRYALRIKLLKARHGHDGHQSKQ